MKRRDFLRFGAQKAVAAGAETIRGTTAMATADWIRPPYAEREDIFLSRCTKCDDCIAACPHNVLFPLPARLGDRVAGTPAMDLGCRGCHLCADWPCVAACETGALQRTESPEDAAPARPKLARLTINQGTCLPYAGPECGACASVCPVPGALIWEGGLRPVIDETICTGCALCREACIIDPKAVDIRSPDHYTTTQKMNEQPSDHVVED